MTYKIHKRNASASQPRLVMVRQHTKPKQRIGFLDVDNSLTRIEVGTIDSLEFLLVQCLFSPQNFLSAKYNPVSQTYDRIAELVGYKNHKRETRSSVTNSVRALQKQKIGNYLTFIFDDNTMRMEVVS